MKHHLSRAALAFVGAGVLSIYGCGGGGGADSQTPSTTITAVSVTAATGAAFEGAIITITDKTGATVGTSSPVGADGIKTITLSSGAIAPYVLTATRTNADGATETLVSVLPSGTGTSATASVNITPITHLIAARLSPSGDPTRLAAEVGSGAATVNTTTVGEKVTEVQTILAPVLSATATTGTNPLTGTFAADGTGYDRLLDSVKVTITPESNVATNIEVALKIKQAEGASPLVAQFKSNAVGTPPAVPDTVLAGDILPTGTSAKIQAHLAQLTSCYALPTSTRVPSGTTAADIVAPACKNAFYGNDPASFLSNGKRVSATESFSGIFKSGVQDVVFSQGNYEFTRAADGLVVVSYKSRASTGAETYDTFALKEDTDGKLKQYGNQYAYGGSVSAYQQIRKFPTLTQSSSDYYSTGYNINIPKAGLDHVAVTTPRGNTLILKSQAGYDNLQLVTGWGGTADTPTGGNTTGTSFVRVRSEYVDELNTNDPGTSTENTRLFFTTTPFTNAEIAAIPANSVWTYKYYLTGAPNTVAATQYYKTRARALTVPELRKQQLAVLTSAQISSLQSLSIPFATAPSPAGQLPITDSRTSLSVAYDVPTGALPPTSLKIWGKYSATANFSTSSISFSDDSAVASTARSGNVSCVNAAGGDAHCSSNAFVNPTRINGIHLWARDVRGREFASFYALYQL